MNQCPASYPLTPPAGDPDHTPLISESRRVEACLMSVFMSRYVAAGLFYYTCISYRSFNCRGVLGLGLGRLVVCGRGFKCWWVCVVLSEHFAFLWSG